LLQLVQIKSCTGVFPSSGSFREAKQWELLLFIANMSAKRGGAQLSSNTLGHSRVHYLDVVLQISPDKLPHSSLPVLLSLYK